MAPTQFSPVLPSLKTMPLYQWVDAMRALREQVADAAASVLDKQHAPEHARVDLQPIFDAYTEVDINGDSEDRRDAPLSIEIKVNAEALVFWVFPTNRYESIVYTDAGYWWLNQDGSQDAAASPHQLHRALIERVLKMIPWANDDAIDEIAALEAATRAG